MGGAATKSELLHGLIQKQLDGFKLDGKLDGHIYTPTPSMLPINDFTSHFSRYTKFTADAKCPHVRFISKDKEACGFIWETTGEKLRLGTRWGITDTESVTGKVISTLGQYRIIAQKRILNGVISNTHRIKIALLDHYQDRCEALQALESMVNKNNSKADFKKELNLYVDKLKKIQVDVDESFKDTKINTLEPNALQRIKADIDADIKRAESYLAMVEKSDSTDKYSQAYGEDSILEFVKSQMVHHLYEFQGINQDVTYSRKRRFAATRGDLNNCIEDARKVIDDYRSDLRNPVTSEHHGSYTAGKTYVYDYMSKGLTPERERDVLLAISSIHDYDILRYDSEDKPHIYNSITNTSRPLTVIHATNWRTTRTVLDFFKRIGWGLLNMLISLALPTRPWPGNPWGDGFHLAAATLIENAKENYPIWHKPIQLIKQIFYSLVDGVKSIEEIGKKIIIELPKDIQYDFECTKATPDLSSLIQSVHAEIKKIEDEESAKMASLILDLNQTAKEKTKLDIQPFSAEFKASVLKFAQAKYHLTPGEQNDILSALARGLGEFSNVFTHNMFAKDPVSGLAFTALYLAGGMIILAPNTMAFLGEAILASQKALAVKMGDSVAVQAVSLAVTDASVGLLVVDAAEQGLNSITAKAAEELANELPKFAIYFAVAQGIGFLLTVIPGIGPVILSELGEMPLINRFFVGAKVGVVIFEISQKEQEHPIIKIKKTTANGIQDISESELNVEEKINYNQLRLVLLLSNHHTIAKLDSSSKHNIERQIDHWFKDKPSEADSLKKVLYPEVARSIAYYLIVIPLSYIPALLRLIISPILSFAALLMGLDNPAAPMKNAAFDLLKKSTRDLTRLIVFAKELFYVVYSGFASLFRMLVNVANLTVGRVAGWCGFATGHDSHKVFAAIHVFFRMIGEFFNPGRILKSVVSAHPTPAMEKIAISATSSSSQMLGKLGGKVANSKTFPDTESAEEAVEPTQTADTATVELELQGQQLQSGRSFKA